MPVPSSQRAPDTSPVLRGGESSLGPFRLLRRLGRGGFAPVWLAEELYEGKKLRDVAVKLFHPPDTIPRGSAEEARWHDRIIDEARALCRVEHPNVVRFYSLHRDDASGAVGLAMEYLAGAGVDVRLKAAGKLPDHEVIEIGIAVAWALSAVHNAGLIHRDIKPGNIIQGASGYKLIDFGIVVDHLPEASRPAPTLIGTPGYIAPECLDLGAPPSPGSDLYGLGATLLKLRSGELPNSLLRLPSLPGDPLGKLLLRLLDPDPGARPRHADWVARELERLWTRGAPAPPLAQEIADPSEPTPAQSSSRQDILPTRESHTPAPLALCQHAPLVGRAGALATLDRAAEEAKQGALRFALITGPLGIGRTRLLEAAVARAGVDAARVIKACCSPERRSLLRPLVRGIEALPDGAAGGPRSGPGASTSRSARCPSRRRRRSSAG